MGKKMKFCESSDAKRKASPEGPNSCINAAVSHRKGAIDRQKQNKDCDPRADMRI